MNKLFTMVAVLLMAVSGHAAEYLVKYKNNMAVQTFTSNRMMQLMDVHDAGQLMTVNINDNSLKGAMVTLLSNPNIEYVVPNTKVHAFYAPVEAQALKAQYALAKVQAEKAWARAGNKGSKNVLVAVIDTGVDYKHKNLASNMVAGYDFARNDADPDDQTSAQNPGHGTHCAGIIGANGLVDNGIVGLSPEVSMMPLRFLDERGSGDLGNGVKAIDYAISKGAQVISASWGASIPRSQAMPLIEAIQRAEAAGIVFVVAAANDGKNNDTTEVYPANAGLSNTISVAASDANDAKPSWSNYGKAKVNVAAPGHEIMSTIPKDGYQNLSGTSMATPLVAGLVALVKAQDPSLTPSQIRSLLQATGAKVSIQTACDCRVDAFEAIDVVMSKKMFISPNAASVAKGTTVQFEAVYGKGPFQYSMSNAAVGTIDAATGLMSAANDGETTVTVTDSSGATSTSYKIYVGGSASPQPPDPGNPGSCPIGDQALCDIICQIMPDAPFCAK